MKHHLYGPAIALGLLCLSEPAAADGPNPAWIEPDPTPVCQGLFGGPSKPPLCFGVYVGKVEIDRDPKPKSKPKPPQVEPPRRERPGREVEEE